jgi:hypothetical protein
MANPRSDLDSMLAPLSRNGSVCHGTPSPCAANLGLLDSALKPRTTNVKSNRSLYTLFPSHGSSYGVFITLVTRLYSVVLTSAFSGCRPLFFFPRVYPSRGIKNGVFANEHHSSGTHYTQPFCACYRRFSRLATSSSSCPLGPPQASPCYSFKSLRKLDIPGVLH